MTEMRPAIIKLHEKGKSVREIEELLDVPKSTVQYHIKRYEETGSHKNKPKGRPEKAPEIGKTSSVGIVLDCGIVETSTNHGTKAWDEIPVETLAKTVDNFPKRLKACVEAEGGHFE